MGYRLLPSPAGRRVTPPTSRGGPSKLTRVGRPLRRFQTHVFPRHCFSTPPKRTFPIVSRLCFSPPPQMDCFSRLCSSTPRPHLRPPIPPELPSTDRPFDLARLFFFFCRGAASRVRCIQPRTRRVDAQLVRGCARRCDSADTALARRARGGHAEAEPFPRVPESGGAGGCSDEREPRHTKGEDP